MTAEELPVLAHRTAADSPVQDPCCVPFDVCGTIEAVLPAASLETAYAGALPVFHWKQPLINATNRLLASFCVLKLFLCAAELTASA